jgi:hypothetical protein
LIFNPLTSLCNSGETPEERSGVWANKLKGGKLMPCDTIIINTVEFKVENIDVLEKAAAKIGLELRGDKKGKFFVLYNKTTNTYPAEIDFETGKISSSRMEEKQLYSFSNSLKRSYSEAVIDEIAKRQKWLKKQVGENKFQLRKY